MGRTPLSLGFALGSLVLLTGAGKTNDVMGIADGGAEGGPDGGPTPDASFCLPSCCIMNCSACASGPNCPVCAAMCGQGSCGCDCTPFACPGDSGVVDSSPPPFDSGGMDSTTSCQPCCTTNSVCSSCVGDANCPACLQGCCSFQGCDCTPYYMCPASDAATVDSAAPDSGLFDAGAPDTGGPPIDCVSCCSTQCSTCASSASCPSCAAQCNSGGVCAGCDCSRYVCPMMGGADGGGPSDSGGGPPPPSDSGALSGDDGGTGGGGASTSGCGCRTAPAPSAGAGWFSGLLFAFAMRRRRGRAHRKHERA